MTLKITQADWDRVWLELAELRQSLNARPIAPTPDYRSDLPADEPCSCEESERLKAELGEAQVENTELRRLLVRRVEASRLANAQLAAANALLKWLSEELPGVYRGQINAHLSSQPAAPTPGCDHGAMPCSERDPFCARPRALDRKPHG